MNILMKLLTKLILLKSWGFYKVPKRVYHRAVPCRAVAPGLPRTAMRD